MDKRRLNSDQGDAMARRCSERSMVRLDRIENGAPDRIRTCDLWNRNPTLYPAELRARAALRRGSGGLADPGAGGKRFAGAGARALSTRSRGGWRRPRGGSGRRSRRECRRRRRPRGDSRRTSGSPPRGTSAPSGRSNAGRGAGRRRRRLAARPAPSSQAGTRAGRRRRRAPSRSRRGRRGRGERDAGRVGGSSGTRKD